MQVNLKPQTEARLIELASKSGCTTDDLVEDALAAYLAEAGALSEMLDNRCEDIKSGRVKPIDGETFFDSLRQREAKAASVPNEEPPAPKDNLSDLLLNSPFAGSKLDLDRHQDAPRRADLE